MSNIKVKPVRLSKHKNSKQNLLDRIEHAQISVSTPSKCTSSDRVCRERFDVFVPNYVSIEKNEMVIPLKIFDDVWDGSCLNETRINDISISSNFNYQEEVNIAIPDGWELVSDIEQKSYSGSAVDISIKVSREQGRVSIQRSIEIHEGLWPSSEYESFRTAIRSYAALRKFAITLRKIAKRKDRRR